MQGAMKLADNRGLLGVGGEELRKLREAFRDELLTTVSRVSIIRRAAIAQIEGDGSESVSRQFRRK